jgi:hypothetical protein
LRLGASGCLRQKKFWKSELLVIAGERDRLVEVEQDDVDVDQGSRAAGRRKGWGGGGGWIDPDVPARIIVILYYEG